MSIGPALHGTTKIRTVSSFERRSLLIMGSALKNHEVSQRRGCCRGSRDIFAASAAGLLLASALCFCGCAKAMRDDGRVKPLEQTSFFADQATARPRIEGTVARGETGSIATATNNPMPITFELLQHGRERYDIYCAPCHDRLGTGHGTIVQRGFKPGVPFTDERLRRSSDGYFFDAITKGFQSMYPMAAQIPPSDRWAIVAYVRALQRSQHASIDDVPTSIQQTLK